MHGKCEVRGGQGERQLEKVIYRILPSKSRCRYVDKAICILNNDGDRMLESRIYLKLRIH